MSLIATSDLLLMFRAIAAELEEQKGRLSELDGVVGDADHGVTMALGFAAVDEALHRDDRSAAEPSVVLNEAAKAFLNAVGASSGPLYATAFIRAGASVKGLATLDRDAIVNMLSAMVRGIQDRGKAERGEKTMIDAWLPAAEAAQAARHAGKDLAACLRDAVAAAEAGAEATKSMIASKGRAARLGERAIGHVDPGAASAVIVLRVMAGALGK